MPENKSTSKKSTSVSDQGTGRGDLGRASYRAEQARDAVIIFAFGWHPTPGYTDFFEQSMIEIFPPEFIFHSIPPGWMVPQVLTPFSIWVMFGATEPIKTVTVHDADGAHEIDVEQTADTLAAANQRATWVVGHVVRGGGIGSRASTLGIGEEEPGPTWFQGEEDLRFGGGVGARASTMGIGEEEPGPTWVQGEEDLRFGRGLGTRATTMATGEEGGGPTTMATGEEDITGPTTMAVGEESGGPTTMATGEEEARAGATFIPPPITTMAVAEEAVFTTLRLGEEGGGGTTALATTLDLGEESQTFRLANTTMAIGEEDPTTLAVGEENPTTQAAGEEGGPTTLALGEETTVAVRTNPFGTF